ncbi:MAG TPA: ABC transporter ATP-binding protein [Candidatus Binatia bacterium]|nr:ABC transporter ATP-binding protein [Candidatus Binatia bacterium]
MLLATLRPKAAERNLATQDAYARVPAAYNGSAPIALRVEGLQKQYGAKQPVAGVSFAVRAGEVFGLLGPNGAGKTTTIAMLATQRRPSGGEATLFGHRLSKDVRRVRRVIGLVPQALAVYPMLTAAENLRFFGRVYGMAGAELADRIDELLQFVGLAERRDEYVGTFSGGMKRRLNLAVGLVHRPKVLLLDEPTAGVDPQSREHIFALVRQLRAAGTAILYVTHYMEEAEGLCDRLGIMNQGKLVAVGTLDELLANLGCAEIVEVRGLPTGTDLSRLKALGGLCRMESSDGVTRLFVNNAAHFLAPLQQLLSRASGAVHVKMGPLSLEHLFLHLTGKELHD